MRWGGLDRALIALLFVGVVLGCASTQKVSLECVPSDVKVFVDGRELEGRPSELELSKDEAHTVYFKGGGYRTQMVVLESGEVDGEVRLSPADLCQEVVFAEMKPDVVVELEEEPAPAKAR